MEVEMIINSINGSLVHELRHLVQYVLLDDPSGGKQVAKKKDYVTDHSSYFTSPLEFDPWIGNAVHEFLELWEIANNGGMRPNFGASIRKFVGCSLRGWVTYSE